MVASIDEGRINFNFKKSAWEISVRKRMTAKMPSKQTTGLEVNATLPDGTPITTSSQFEDWCQQQLKKARRAWNNEDHSDAERYLDSYLA
jgi:hypothetical protein